jgi:uncharacterized membrane protein
MKNKAKFCRQIVAVIGITLLVAGSPRTSRSDDGRDFAEKSTFAKIDVPGSAGYPAPNGINAQGDIVGTYGAILNNNAVTRGFLLSKGTFTSIDVPGALAGSSSAVGINSEGDIVGAYSDSGGNAHGFLRSKGRFTTIYVPGAIGSFGNPSGINPEGDIVGFYFDGSGLTHGFLLRKEKRLLCDP